MKKILITGATGFIGGRLAEVACQREVPVVALVRRWPRAARLGRLPVSMASGDVLDPASLRQAMRGCDVVFHSVVDETVGGEAHRRVSVEGTQNVLRAALETGVERVVHLSSTAVYSYRPGPDAGSEEGAYRYSRDPYCDAKIDSEKAALDHAGQLPVVVLRPTYVYGPFGYYSEQLARSTRSGGILLVNGGTGLCNSLYVDNLVEAMFLAARHEKAPGEVFHISDADPITWREFVEGHARGLGEEFLPLPERTVEEIEALRAPTAGVPVSSLRRTLALLRDDRTHTALVSIPAVHRAVDLARTASRALLPASVRRSARAIISAAPEEVAPAAPAPADVALPSTNEVDIQTRQVPFRIDKARRLLGYEPRIDFAEGMARTVAWIRWARF